MTRLVRRALWLAVVVLVMMVSGAVAQPGGDPEIDAFGSGWTRQDVSGRASRLFEVGARDGLVVAAGSGGIWSSNDGSAWAQVVEADGVRGVAVGAAGFVAVGDCSEPSDCPDCGCDRAGVWVSTDGQDWTVFPAAPMQAGPVFAFLNAVVPTDSGFIAAGQADSASAAVWASTDGREWSLVHEHPGVNSAIGDLSASTAGLIAVGHTSREVPRPEWAPDPIEVRSAGVWLSSDGTSWRHVSGDADLFGPTSTETPDAVANWQATAAVADGDVLAVAGQVAYGLDGHVADEAAVVWFSGDGGRSWTRTEDPDLFGRAEINDVDLVSNHVVAVGRKDGVGAAAWASPDGINWQQLTLDDETFGSRSTIHDLLVREDDLIAVGDSAGAAVWTKTREQPAATDTAEGETPDPELAVTGDHTALLVIAALALVAVGTTIVGATSDRENNRA